MKKKILLAACATLLGLQPVHAQYTIGELVQGFYAQYVEKSSSGQEELNSMDMLMYGHETTGTIRQSVDRHFLCYDERLHAAGGIKLPPSVFVELYESHNDDSGLYWYSLRDSTDMRETERVRAALQRKYGSKRLPGGAVLIPVRWFDGELHTLLAPFLYGNMPVSPCLGKMQIDGGTFAKNAQGYDLTYDHGYPEIESDAWFVATTSTGHLRETGSKDRKLTNYRAMELLSREISRGLDMRLLPEDMERSYAIMFHLDDYDKAHLYPLLPRELTVEDKLLLTVLSNAVEQLPARTFAKLRSARGAYPAMFLRAHFKCGRWFFEDYRFIE